MISNRVLVLERKKPPQGLIKELLRKLGLEVKEEVMAEHTKDLVEKLMPQIVIINSIDGEEISLRTCRDLKENRLTATIPVIVLLDGNNDDYKKQFIDVGIDDYLEFPYNEYEFIHRIKKMLRVGELEKKNTLSRQALEESLETIENQKKELNYNLSLAAKIQEALIPKTIGNIPNCSFEWKFKPSGKVGGDIFDVFMLDEDNMGLYMIDVMGHGVASSMLAVALSEFLIIDVERGSPLKRKIDTPPYYEILSPLHVIEYLNKRFPFSKYNHYFTIFYMVMNVKTGILKYVRAAHPSPILVKNNGYISELDGYGTPVGFEFSEGYEEKIVQLDSGDNLIIYTDGLLEIEDEIGNVLKIDDLLKHFAAELENNSNHLTSNLNKWIGNRTIKDDLTVLEMKWVKFI